MPSVPPIVDRESWEAQLAELRVREKAHTREGDAVAAARRRLPMVEVDPEILLEGQNGKITLLEAFEGRNQLFASYHMWHTGKPAARQCVGCTFNSGQAHELSYLHARGVTFAVFCDGPYSESSRYRDFMGWNMPWYAVHAESRDRLLAGRHFGMKVCYLRDGDRVFETYWTTGRGCEAMSGSYGMLDMTVYGRQETGEDSPAGWPQPFDRSIAAQYSLLADGSPVGPDTRDQGRPMPQWSRIAAGYSDELGG